MLAETVTSGGGIAANVTRTVADRLGLAKETETVGLARLAFTAGAAGALEPPPSRNASAKPAIATAETIDTGRWKEGKSDSQAA